MSNNESPQPVLIVGAGVVGRAIAIDHLKHHLPVWIADQCEDALRQSCDMILNRTATVACSAAPWGIKTSLPIAFISPGNDPSVTSPAADPNTPWLLIESIAERLDVKQAFFRESETWFDRPAVLTTNTSTLSIRQIAEGMQSPHRLAGFHFFMPVVGRDAIELIQHPSTDSAVIETCQTHAQRLGKSILPVDDTPGFIVNRLLSPYLNLAMWLLCGGVPANVIRQGALHYGMPMSPLELVDLIGPRTAFDGGRIVWQAYPNRMNPSPLLPAIVKRKLLGVAGRVGFYEYDADGRRLGDELSETVTGLAKNYHHNEIDSEFDKQSCALVSELLAACLQSEAKAIQDDGTASADVIEKAIIGGLGWHPNPDSAESSPLRQVTTQRCQQLAQQFPRIKTFENF